VFIFLQPSRAWTVNYGTPVLNHSPTATREAQSNHGEELLFSWSILQNLKKKTDLPRQRTVPQVSILPVEALTLLLRHPLRRRNI
jgi:hypothetical protein